MIVDNSERLRVIEAATGVHADCSYAILENRLKALGFVMIPLPTTMAPEHFDLLLKWPEEWWRTYVVKAVAGNSDAHADEVVEAINKARSPTAANF